MILIYSTEWFCPVYYILYTLKGFSNTIFALRRPCLPIVRYPAQSDCLPRWLTLTYFNWFSFELTDLLDIHKHGFRISAFLLSLKRRSGLPMRRRGRRGMSRLTRRCHDRPGIPWPTNDAAADEEMPRQIYEMPRPIRKVKAEEEIPWTIIGSSAKFCGRRGNSEAYQNSNINLSA